MGDQLTPIMFRCGGGRGHIISRAEAKYINGDWRCPRHYQLDTQQTELIPEGGETDA